MHFGAAWYPEHWPETRWMQDIELMRAAAMNVCRIAEFAWSTLEPTEGQYEFGWLDRAIELLHANGIEVVLGTPTAAPPAWLTQHHPDTLAIDQNGRVAQHGNRCHYSPMSMTYFKYARRIAEQMARRYGKDARVIGWQIDNEYNRVDYSENSGRLFQQFLKDRYTTLGALNAAWSTAYWSQTYGDWNDIPIPIGPHNPGLMLSWRHFVTHTWRSFQKMQIEAIRQFSLPQHWITHNFMGWFDGFDHYEVAADLDFASWDWYVGNGHHDYLRTGAAHDLTRGLKRRNFWLMETQPGSVNWHSINNTLNRNEARCMAWHATAHGADALLYWQWRSALGGQEQLHGSLLGADGKPRPFYAEAAEIGRDFARIGEKLAGTEPVNQVAILHSYDSRWSINAQRHHKDFDPVEHLLDYYRPLAAANVGVDVISAEAALDGYKLVVAPSIVVLTPQSAANLSRYVHSGGTLVLTARCGQKDRNNALFPALQPGPIRELAGVEVAEYFALDSPAPVLFDGISAGQSESHNWAEMLRPVGESGETEVLARYGACNGWLDGQPAITRHSVGALGGSVVYIGAWLDSVSQAAVINWVIAESRVSAVWPVRIPGVEAVARKAADGRTLLFLINHTETPIQVNAPSGSITGESLGEDLLTGDKLMEEFTIEPYGVRVFERT